MKNINCQICGTENPDLLKNYFVVPQSINQEAEIKNPKTVKLCFECQQELGIWYSAKIGGLYYDTVSKQFRPKTAINLAKEYEAAYRTFNEYKYAQETASRSRA